jgi:hypothetical protein
MYEVTDGKGSHRMGGSKASSVPTGGSGDKDVDERGALLKEAEETFYGGGQGPPPAPTPTPTPEPKKKEE